jgi:hypothetical protein
MSSRTRPSTPAPRSLRVITIDKDFTYGVYSNLVFGLESADPSIAYIDGFNRTIQEIVRQSGRKVGMMVVIHADAKPPTDEVRRHIVRTARGFAPHVAAFAHVVEGEGFLAAAKRAAMTLLMSTARFGFPLKVFSNVREAMPWLLTTVGSEFPEQVRADQLSTMVDELRRSQFGLAASPLLRRF